MAIKWLQVVDCTDKPDVYIYILVQSRPGETCIPVLAAPELLGPQV